MALTSGVLSAAERVALVIGNNDYLHARKLETAVGDAQAVATELRAAGFEVLEKANLKHNDFPVAMNEFLVKAKDASAVLFYFAGHGVESESYGGNFLLPVDAALEQEAHLESQTTKLDTVLDKLRGLRAPVRLVVLDCCRNNPLEGRSWTGNRGETGLGTLNLQRLDAATMVVFSASPGKVARDRARPGDVHSPFATVFLEHLKKPGGTALATFAAVENGVVALTGGGQRSKTFFSGSLSPFNDFMFRPPGQGGGEILPPLPPDPYVLIAGKAAGERKLVEVAPGVSIPLRWCPPGSFTMGSPKAEQDKVPESVSFKATDETAHPVTLTRGFWMAETEVTQGQWEAVAGTTLFEQGRKALEDDTIYYRQTFRDTMGQKRTDKPVVGVESEKTAMFYVSHADAEDWCARASRHAGVRGWMISLPTEAQWEYACRAANPGMGHDGNFQIEGDFNAPGLGRIAWYGGNSSEGYGKGGWGAFQTKNREVNEKYAGPRRVASRKPNAWGIYDMLGNVREWCSDRYGAYPTDAVTDPEGADPSNSRVARGGGWWDDVYRCRSAARHGTTLGWRDYQQGFRPVLTLAK